MVAFFSGVIGMWLSFFRSGEAGKRLRFFQWNGQKVVLCGCLYFQWSVRTGCCCFYRVVSLGGLFSMVRSRVYGLWNT